MLVPVWLLQTLEKSLLTVLVKGGLLKISEAAEGLHETRLQTKRFHVISQFKEEMSSLRGRVVWWFMSLQIQMNVFIRKPNLSVKSLIMLHAFSQMHVGGPGRKTQTNKETDKKGLNALCA